MTKYIKISGTKWADLLNGTGLKDKIMGKGGGDILNGHAGDDRINGGNGNDTITGGRGNDTIYGGSGIDTAVFKGRYQEYVLSFSSDGDLTGTVRDLVANRDGRDSLKHVEFLQFSNAIYDVRNDVFFILNHAPIALNDTVSTKEDTLITISSAALLANDTDLDVGDTKTLVSVFAPLNGTVILSGGHVTFTPTANFNGVASFKYTMKDAEGVQSTASVNVTVTPVNDAPVARPDAAGTDEDHAININVRVNDSDVDAGAVLTVQSADHVSARGALVSINANGTLRYDPTSAPALQALNTGQQVEDTFTYTVADERGAASRATVTVKVAGQNDIEGLAEDGYVVGATVFADANGNRQLNAGEASAITDSAGHFSLGGPLAPLVLKGGTDIATGLPFLGEMRAPVGYSTITPLTTLVSALADTGVPVDQAKEKVLTAFGIDPAINLAGFDPIAQTLGGNAMGAKAFVADTLILDTVSMAGSLVAGARSTTFANAAANVLSAMAAQIAALPAGGVLDLGNAATLTTIIGATPLVPPSIVSGGVAVIAASNLAVSAHAQTAGTGTALLADLTQIAIVAQGDASLSLLRSGVGTVPIATTVAAFTGANLTNAINNAAGHTGDVDGPGIQNAPIARNDSLSTNEDQPLIITRASLLSNDSDYDGNALTLSLLGSPTHGMLVSNPNGSFTYRAAANYNGADTFTYRVNDGALNSNTATVNLSVNAVNDAPKVGGAGNSVTYNERGAGVVLDGALRVSDVDSSNLVRATVTIAAGLQNGDVLRFTNQNGITGSYSGGVLALTGTASVAQYQSALRSVSFENVSNDDPTHFGASRTIDWQVSDGTGGLSLQLPAPFATGNRPFMVAMGDVNGDGRQDVAVVNQNSNNVSVLLGNGNGTFQAQSQWALPSSSAPVAVAIGDLNGDGRLDLAVANRGNSTVSGSISVLLGNGNGTFQAAAQFAPGGIAPTAVAIADLNGDGRRDLVVTNEGSNSVSVLRGNGNGTFQTPTQSATGVAPNAMVLGDVNGDGRLDLAVVNGTSNTVSVLLGNPDGTFQSQTQLATGAAPDAVALGDLNGDGRLDLAVANFNSNSVSVLLGNGNGTFQTQTQWATASGPSAVAIGDVNGDGRLDLAVASFNSANGSLLLGNGDGTFQAQTPLANGNGSADVALGDVNGDGTLDVAFANTNANTVSVLLNNNTHVSAVQHTTVNINAANDSPVANPDSYATNEDTPVTIAAAAGVLANDSDAERAALTAAMVAAPTHGALTLNPNGSFTYTPTANYNGADSFTYRANDGATNSGVATVTLTVNSVNDAPVAVNDSYTTAEDTVLTIAAMGVLANDVDVDGNVLTAGLLTGPAHGSLTLNSNGSFTYTPTTNYTGSDSFTYRANDGTANSNIATVNLTVNPVNDAPVAVNDSYSTDEDTARTIAVAAGVLVNDSDVEGNALSAVLQTAPVHGALTLNANGSFTYTPTANYNGADSFTYRANDGTANSSVATVNLTVNPVNDPPVAVDDSYSTEKNTAFSVAPSGVLANDSDVDGDALTAALVTGAAHGTIGLGSDGSFTYTPATDYIGPDSFTYKANDASADSNTATVNITVNPVNVAPVAVGDSTNVDKGGTLFGSTVLANDSDSDSPTLSAVLNVGPTHGALALNSNGTFVYTPAAGFVGVDSFQYEASDGSHESNAATVTITVNPVASTEYLWSTLADTQVLSSFKSGADVLRFDGTAISAAAVDLASGSTVISQGGKTVTLEMTRSITIDATDRGSYFHDTAFPTPSYFHDPANTDYQVGQDLPVADRNNFFVFDLTGISGAVTSASLVLFNRSFIFPGFASGDPTETYDVHQITTPASALINGTAGFSGHVDMEDGPLYGTHIASNADNGTFINIPLNGAALADIQSALGTSFAVGGTISTIQPGFAPPGGVSEFLFHFSGGPDFPMNNTRLVLTTQADESSITTSNVTFDDGSALLVGDNSTASAADGAANTLSGGTANDRLIGLGGADTLIGGSGNDLMDGGAGIDTFVYQALSDRGTTGDVITGFIAGPGGDVLNLHELLQTFSGYTGGNAFSGGYLRFKAAGADTLVEVDSDGGANSFATLATLTSILLQQSDAANYVL